MEMNTLPIILEINVFVISFTLGKQGSRKSFQVMAVMEDKDEEMELKNIRYVLCLLFQFNCMDFN